MRLIWGRLDRIYDPGTPAGDLAGLLGEQYGGEPVPAGLVTQLLTEGSTAERLAGAAEAMLASGDGAPSVTALTFGAAVARTAGDGGKARRLLGQALDAAGDPDTRLDVIEHLRESGRRAEAIELFEARLREAPDDLHAAEHYADAIEDAFARLTGEEPAGERTAGRPDEEGTAGACPCGEGAPWEECCGPREHASLSRFTDRSGLTALREALGAYVARSGYGAAIDEEAAEWLPAAGEAGLDPGGRAALADLAAEHGLLMIGTGDDEEDEGEDVLAWDENEDEYEEDEDTAVAAFAADPSVPPELAARARDWHEHMHYGLWRAGDPHQAPSPGLWCTDIATGISRYAEVPADLVRALSRWTVWLGGAVPVDGIWRFTGPGMRLSPMEGDAAVQLVRMTTEALAFEIAGKPRKSDALRRAAETMPFGRAEPHGVVAEFEDPPPPIVASLIRLVTGMLLPRIVAEVCEHRGGGTGDLAAASLAASDAKRWFDEPVLALRGRTPRQAAIARPTERAMLETLLRQFEYDAGLPAAEGKPAIDTAWLRQELDMDDGPED